VGKAKGAPCIVTGDFNEPQYIIQDGRIVTWGQERETRHGHFVCRGTWKDSSGRSDFNEKWDSAVRWLFEKQDEHGLRHTYWEARGRGSMDVSHMTRGQKRWFDHMFVSSDFHVERCDYLHKLRGPCLSDHSGLSARLTLRAQS
jgi:endonuclease/exonuclease/phosphatase family metal-dependent hydrolase